MPYLLIACATLLLSCAPQSPRPQELFGALAAGKSSVVQAWILRDENTPPELESLLLGATIGPLYVDADAATLTARVSRERWNALPPEQQSVWLERIDLVPEPAEDCVVLRFHFQLEDDIWKLDLRRPTLARSQNRRTGA